MNYKSIMVLILVISLLFVVGCNSQPRYSGSNYNPGNQPQPSAGGCGVVAPAEDQGSVKIAVQPSF